VTTIYDLGAMEWRAMHTPVNAIRRGIMKRTMLFFTVLPVLVAFVAVPMIADATETQCAPQCPQCPPAQVEVVNKPVVKAKQRGKWDVTVNNDEANPVKVCDVCTEPCVREHVWLHKHVWFTPGSNTVTLLDAVPTGKLLVIETISAYTKLCKECELRYAYLAATDPTTATKENLLMVPMQYTTTDALDKYYVGTVSAKAVLTEGSVLEIRISSFGPDPPFLHTSVLGYFVDAACPTP
jgi:hypothetical protein